MNNIIPMNPNESVNFLLRAFDDLEAADGFVGVTKRKTFEVSALKAIGGVLAWAHQETFKVFETK